ncbi:hypothetical protein FGIG_07242 [Fasciola gigantica]|uniref:Uncharacterized protein n=1 Tax=Fasciola gigantica TaxID=46835 RepID=A0A504Y693_FASGI|nr:hypothetical protein FGIG_07242 [Fasciola gigantica]
MMTGLKLEDPTVDVTDIEKYRLAFLMQFFVQHKPRFRFPRLRLQDLYQRVIKDPEPTAFCDLVARILRFLGHGDPDITIDHVDQALDRFTVDKRTSYRIQMQRHRNGKPVHQLNAEARAALLDNLIESVYDEQPDFNFTATGFNTSTGLPNGVRSSNGCPGDGIGPTDPDGNSLFGGGGAGSSSSCLGLDDGTVGVGDFNEQEDVNVLIKAGQDAQGCSYYYMDDLRLYRERPQSGISSQWDVAVGPTAAQWRAFISSLSRNEKEYDLYYFLQHELFELVKESLDVYELHAVNGELDTTYLRAKETSELAELRRVKGLSAAKSDGPNADEVKFPLATVTNLGSNGPKSASPAFSGGHGACGVGSAGSSTSGAPLTPSSARTPTSAPPATTLLPNGYMTPSNTGSSAQTPVESVESHGLGKTEANVFTTRASGSLTTAQPAWSSDIRTTGTTRTLGQTNGDAMITPAGPTIKQEDVSKESPSPAAALDSGITRTVNGPDSRTASILVQKTGCLSTVKSSPSSVADPNLLVAPAGSESTTLSATESNCSEPTSHIERELGGMITVETHDKSSPVTADGAVSWTQSNSRSSLGPSPLPASQSQRAGAPTSDPSSNKGLNGNLADQSHFNSCAPSSIPMTDNVDPSPSVVRGPGSVHLPSSTANAITTAISGPLTTTATPSKSSPYAFDPNTRSKELPCDSASLRSNLAAVRPQGPCELSQTVPPPQPSALLSGDTFVPNNVDCAFGHKGAMNKTHMNPVTALVPPMVGLPDGGATLTQEQWENRKSKIAQLEKIHSTLSKSKSASTPGAVAAAAGAVLQQQQQQQQQQQHRLQSSVVGPPPPMLPSSIAQPLGPMPSHALGVNASMGFGSPPYTGPQRPGGLDAYGGPRPVMMPGAPPSDIAQREWDRLCMDYQREKGEPPGPRFHPSCRQPVMYDPNGCPIMPTDPSTPPHGGTLPPGAMVMSGQMMIDHSGCGSNTRHFGPPMDGPGLGPPVVMVPPNNTNLTSANLSYPPPPASGSLTAAPQHFRSMPPTVSGSYPGPDQQVPFGVLPPGHKRPYHGPDVSDPWIQSSTPHPVMSQVPMNESGIFPGLTQPTGSVAGARMGPLSGGGGGMGSPPIGPGIPVTLSMPIASTTTCGTTTNVNAPPTTGRATSGVGKAGGKKRKTAAANRASVSAMSSATVSLAGPMTTQLPSGYGKSSGPGSMIPGSITPTKPTYPITPGSYMSDNPGMTGPTHPHRSVYMSQSGTSVTVGHPHSQQQGSGPLSHYSGAGSDPYFTHYPDMTGAPSLAGRPLGSVSSGGPEGRRALTPKGTDVFTMGLSGTNASVGTNGVSLGSMPGGRMPPSACQAGFGPGNNGSCPNSSMIHPYLQSPDGSIPNSTDTSVGMRSSQAGSYTQHLTSASLASLARLSQMSGHEGPPYAAGSSSNVPIGNSPGTGGGPLSNPSTGASVAYPNRSNPMMSYPHHPSHHHHQQQPDGSNGGPLSTPHQMPPPQLLRSHSVSSSLKSHTGHDPDQSVINASGLPPQSNPVMHPKFAAPNYHSQQSLPAGMLSTQPAAPNQQPPSIQVNNTFFNAQLNVQQMNYQHVSAPGSTGQMQIHFVQQQQQQQSTPQSHDPSSGVHRSSRAPDASSRMPSATSSGIGGTNVTTTTSAMSSNAGQDYYHSSSEIGMTHRLLPNYPNEMSMKPDQLATGMTSLSTSNSASVGGGPPVSGYGNTSIQITPKTPHTIQYLPTVIPNAPSDMQQQHNVQYTSSARPGPSRTGNGSNTVTTNSNNNSTTNTSSGAGGNISGPLYNNGSTDSDLDPTSVATRQQSVGQNTSFHPGHIYPGLHHSSGAPQTAQSMGNLPLANYHQTPSVNQIKMASSQSHPSGRTPVNSSWASSDPHFDLHNPMGSMAPGPFGPGMDSTHALPTGIAGRPGVNNGPNHASVKSMGSVGYLSNSLGFSLDSLDPGDHMSAPFMTDPMGMNRSGNSAQYGRPQPGGRHTQYEQSSTQQLPQQHQQVPPQHQQHVYRQQQQYNHTQTTQQQQQQHQMFMSSSNYMTDGPHGSSGCGGQVQFVMSSASSSSTMQNCSSSMMSSEVVGMNQGNPDSKPPNYDHSKRTLMIPSAMDEMKSNQMTMYSCPSGSQPPPHMLQSQMGPGRSNNRPLSNTGMTSNSSAAIDAHFGGAYHQQSPFPNSNFPQVPAMGPMYGDKNGRDLMGNPQSSTICDVSSSTATGLSQVTYQSSLMQ